MVSPVGFASQTQVKQKNISVPQKASLANRSCVSTPLHAHKSYAKINFKSSLASHRSWGAAVDAAKNVNFKVFTWTDAKKVYVQLADKLHSKAKFYKHDGLEVVKNQNGVIESVKTRMKNSQLIELHNKGGGVFEHKVGPDIAKHDQNYRFVIIKNDNTVETVKDPYSMRQPSILGWSKIYDHNKYQWHDQDWMNHKVKERISRHHYKNGLKNPYTMSIYETHIDTLTKEGTFEAAKKELKRIKELGFDTIQIMPVENTHSYNWGYDGVDKFAPQESQKGGPDKLKELIDLAHSKYKLNVIIDIVPNHVGPDGNSLSKTGPYSGGPGDFGDKFNYEGKDSENVREFMANTSLNWIENYHADGIRFDMTKPMYMGSDFTLKKINVEVHGHYPDAFTIAEDGEQNRSAITRPLKEWEELYNENEHVNYTNQLNEKIKQKDFSIIENMGFDSEYDYPHQKELAATLLGGWEDRSRNDDKILFYLDGAVRGSTHRVKTITHHDWANLDGTMFMDKSSNDNLGIFYKTAGNSDCEKGQRAAHNGHKINKAIVTGRIDHPNENWEKFNEKNHITTPISKNEAKEGFWTSYRTSKLNIGSVFATKGIKMLFQGTEDASINYFKFAREFSEPENLEKQSKDKGYRVGKAAFWESKRNSINYSEAYKEKMKQHEKFTAKMNEMIHTIPAMNDGEIISTIIHNQEESGLHAIHRKKGDSEIFAVSNFKNKGFENYGLQFPCGNWKEIVNSDSKEFGGAGRYENTKPIDSSKNPQISLPPRSIIFFEKVKDSH